MFTKFRDGRTPTQTDGRTHAHTERRTHARPHRQTTNKQCFHRRLAVARHKTDEHKKYEKDRNSGKSVRWVRYEQFISGSNLSCLCWLGWIYLHLYFAKKQSQHKKTITLTIQIRLWYSRQSPRRTLTTIAAATTYVYTCNTLGDLYFLDKNYFLEVSDYLNGKIAMCKLVLRPKLVLRSSSYQKSSHSL